MRGESQTYRKTDTETEKGTGTERDGDRNSHRLCRVLVGHQVGKTTIIRKFVDHNAPDHYPPTIGVDFGLKDITLDNEKCRVQIWDTAGQERFRAVTSCYFRGAHGVILVYDVTQTRTFDNIRFHLSQAIKFTADDQPMIMVGNKCDLVEQRTVPYEVAARYAEDFGMQLVETSALTRTNIEQVFLRLISQIRERKRREGERGGGLSLIHISEPTRRA